MLIALAAATFASAVTAAPAGPDAACSPAVVLETPVLTVVSDTDNEQLACYIAELGDGAVGKVLWISRAESGELVLVILPLDGPVELTGRRT